MMKEPKARATYAELLTHPWLVKDASTEVDMVDWVGKAVVRRDASRKAALSSKLDE